MSNSLDVERSLASLPDSMAAPGAIGGTTPAAGAFTTLGASGVSSLLGGEKLAGSAPAAAADQVQRGVADINGAGTAAEQSNYEGGGSFLRRVYSAAGAVKQLFIDESVADDATISLPVPTAGHVGMLDISTLIEGGRVAIQSDGTCTVLSGSTNLVATDTDVKLCVFNDAATPKIRNRLGGARWVNAIYTWS